MSSAAVTASAPGKVVMSGEYAVLNGAPALCMAVNRRAVVTVRAVPDEHHIVTAPGHVEAPRRFLVRDGVFGWLDSSDEFELLEHVWRAAGVDQPGGLELCLDTSAFLDAELGCKTGIGSSAALAVALAFALREFGPDGVDSLETAHRGHLDFQDGLGSGVDVATSATGGLVEYRMRDRSTLQRSIPDGLECRLLWSGSAASTGKKLERYSSNGPKPSREALSFSARRMAEAWAGGSVKAVLDGYREYIEVLQEFNSDHGLGIFDAGHAELVAAAASAGLVYKPCGAGGGDIGMILADNAEAIDDFVASALLPGFRAMNLSLDLQGVQVSRNG